MADQSNITLSMLFEDLQQLSYRTNFSTFFWDLFFHIQHIHWLHPDQIPEQ